MIVALLRVKNEARWIAEVLEALNPCCDRLFVMDDHSTDGTGEIARVCGATVYDSPFTGVDESRDKTWFLDRVQEQCPEGTVCLMIDGDEVLEPSGPAKIRALAEHGTAEAYSFRILYLWNDRQHIRVDGAYKAFARPSMFRLRRGQTFRRTGAHANLHCSSVPASCIGQVKAADVALLHLGYMHREDRIRKFNWYRKIDPLNSVEQGYIHCVLGDLPEYPATMQCRWGGPLKLEALNA